MDGPQAGQPAPDFTLPGTQGEVRLRDLLARGPVVLVFYQEDSTPTCRTQLSNFKGDFDLIRDLDAQVVAVSADPVESHRRFEQELGGLPFPLLSDADLTVARQYGVVDETGKRTRRAVFVIGEDGTVRHAVPYYNPANLQQFQEIFAALGLAEAG